MRRFGAFESEIKGQIGKKEKKTVTKVERQKGSGYTWEIARSSVASQTGRAERYHKLGLEGCAIFRLEAEDSGLDSAAGSADCESVWAHTLSSELCWRKINLLAAEKMDGSGKDCRQ